MCKKISQNREAILGILRTHLLTSKTERKLLFISTMQNPMQKPQVDTLLSSKVVFKWCTAPLKEPYDWKKPPNDTVHLLRNDATPTLRVKNCKF